MCHINDTSLQNIALNPSFDLIFVTVKKYYKMRFMFANIIQHVKFSSLKRKMQRVRCLRHMMSFDRLDSSFVEKTILNNIYMKLILKNFASLFNPLHVSIT